MKLSTALRKAINNLVVAEGADSFKGCGDPDDYEEIEENLDKAKQKVTALLTKVDDLEKKASKI